LSRQALAQGAQKLILLDANESGLFDLASELQSSAFGKRCRIETVVADVTRARRLQDVFAQFQPATVFHVAAYKHVPLMEAHPGEAVLTNVLGTWNVCQAAASNGVKRLVFISTDKAVAPSSVMGATKRLGEQVVRAFATETDSVFCSVRFGNVLGSRGSVVLTFNRQIRKGGPLTVTHSDATRFFMTIPEAASLILEASCIARGGEIFLLDMGQPVRVLDIAHKMIRLHGLRPGEDIRIAEIGLRPGEKLHEVLTTGQEHLESTAHPRVASVRPADAVASVGEVGGIVQELVELAENAPTQRLVDRLFVLAGSDRPSPEESPEPAFIGAR
jgi:FlaA1/EpsC-like NDP-sugar epimerase